jgi:hypothetical protein
MQTWYLPVDKKTQQATQAPSETDKDLKHVVSTVCRHRLFQIALFKGFPNIPHIPLPTGHPVSTNRATMAPTPENAPCWHLPHVPERYGIYIHKINTGNATFTVHVSRYGRNRSYILIPVSTRVLTFSGRIERTNTRRRRRKNELQSPSHMPPSLLLQLLLPIRKPMCMLNGILDGPTPPDERNHSVARWVSGAWPSVYLLLVGSGASSSSSLLPSK